MAKRRAIIVLGDRTSHGGTVVSAWGEDGPWPMTIEGKFVACVGDYVYCPRCRGTHRIIQGAENPPMDLNGRLIATEGCLVSDGSKLISVGQSRAWHESDGDGEEQEGDAGYGGAEFVPNGKGGTGPLDYNLTELRKYSPTLDEDMRRLFEIGDGKKWKIRECLPEERERNQCGMVRDKTIVLDKSESEAALVHEIGHARSPFHDAMERESDAVLYNARIRAEVLENGGPDIGIQAREADRYAQIYGQLEQGEISYAEAQKRISTVVCENETHGGVKYKDIGLYKESCKKILGK